MRQTYQVTLTLVRLLGSFIWNNHCIQPIIFLLYMGHFQ